MTMNYFIAIVDDKHTATALQFASAVLARGHTIKRVFFFKNGVNIGAENHPFYKAWADIAAQHAFDLVLCSAAADHYKVIATDNPVFSIGGLGWYAEAQIICDKVVHFD